MQQAAPQSQPSVNSHSAVQDPAFPVKPGDWVAARHDPASVATVKDVHLINGEYLVDLYLYDRNGDKIGRDSPALGGPRTYEPCCPYANWKRISRPEFPIKLRWVDSGEGGQVARYDGLTTELPDREWRRPRRSKAPVVAAPSQKTSDFNPELEAAARRMAAQELRDTARKHGVPALIARAEELEREAEQLLRRN